MAKTYLGSGVAYDATESATYPKGRMKNDTTETAKDGTPLFKDTLDDSYQAIMELLRRAGITPNEALESKAESQVADAVQFMQPVAILRAGYDTTATAIALFGGKYLAGYTATFAENAVSGTTTIFCKLTINKDGAVSATEKYFVQVTLADTGSRIVSSLHGTDSTGDDFYFDNDLGGNIVFYDPAGTDIAVVRSHAQFIITIYKV